MGEYQKAFTTSLSRETKRATLTYNEAEVFAFFDEISVSPRRIHRRSDITGNPSKAPISIDGMPRSGSTLTGKSLRLIRKSSATAIKNLSSSVAALRRSSGACRSSPRSQWPPNRPVDTIAKNYLAATTRISNRPSASPTSADQFLLCGTHSHDAPNAKRAYASVPGSFVSFRRGTSSPRDHMPHSYDPGGGPSIAKMMSDPTIGARCCW